MTYAIEILVKCHTWEQDDVQLGGALIHDCTRSALKTLRERTILSDGPVGCIEARNTGIKDTPFIGRAPSEILR